MSNDPNVHVTDPKSMFAKVEKVEGGWKISPVSPGTTKLTATLADQTASMAIEINGDGAAAARSSAGNSPAFRRRFRCGRARPKPSPPPRSIPAADKRWFPWK